MLNTLIICIRSVVEYRVFLISKRYTYTRFHCRMTVYVIFLYLGSTAFVTLQISEKKFLEIISFNPGNSSVDGDPPNYKIQLNFNVHPRSLDSYAKTAARGKTRRRYLPL